MKLAGLVLVLALALPTIEAANARTIRAEYSVKVRGFLVGRAEFHADISGERYVLRFSGRAGGIGRIFSNAATTASVTGKLGVDRLLPADYSHAWIEDGETETVAMRFSGRAVTAISLDPAPEHPERYVPLTAETNADALDLVSAFLWPVERATETTCNRKFPLVDGRRRFDIALTFARLDNFATRDGSFASPVAVCTIHYRSVAGHRIGKPDHSILNAKDSEVWMAPLGEGLAFPARIRLQSRVGRIMLEAQSISSK